MFGENEAQDYAAARSRMVAEVDAMYAETRSETGLRATSLPEKRAVERQENRAGDIRADTAPRGSDSFLVPSGAHRA